MSNNKPKEVLSEHKAKVVVSRYLMQQIQYLHAHCPRGTEWSGLLIWQLTKGSIEDLTNLEIRAEAVFPMDYGDASFTSFEGNEDWMKTFQQFPQIDPITPQAGWYIGKIHSHHTMSTYHSQTDKNDLYENAPKLPMFLSLICNYAGDFDCELAISMEVEKTLLERVTWKLKGWKAKQKKIEKTTDDNKLVYLIKCEITKEEAQMDEWMIEQCVHLKTKPKATSGYQYPMGTTYGKDDKKENKTIIVVRAFVTNKVRENIVDLISLGEMYSNSAIYTSLNRINELVGVAYNERENYKKAIKMYFVDYWYPGAFYNVQTDEMEVLEAIQQVLQYQQSSWILGVLKETFNELKTEYPKLWEVQESPLV